MLPVLKQADVVDAGGSPASVAYGGGFIDSASNFGLIRGGHVDACFLGALEVDQEGNLANWIIPGKKMPGMGGAMLAAVACGEYASVEECCDKLVKVVETVEPDPAIAARYKERYQKYRLIYPALKPIFPQIQ